MTKKQDNPIYKSPEEALSATDRFYRERKGFGYDIETVKSWLKEYVKIPKKGKILDICCGDGIWSKGFQELNSGFDLFGIDISAGGIEKANSLLNDNQKNSGQFITGDGEKELPWDKGSFDLIFARGPGLYNQHDFSYPAAVKIIEMWHEYLADGALFYSIFASTPKLMGTYTPMEKVVLPFNRAVRKSDSIDFKGGKYHHSIESFHLPFFEAKSIEIVKYTFVKNLHILVTRKKK